jgi:acyl-coenzyme A thioesterase PaaI-like protein
MKKLIVTIAVALFSILGVNAQKVTTDAHGNYVAVKSERVKAEAKETGKTYTDSKGVVYQVMQSANGKLFVIKTSKNTGNEYRMYLKTEEEQTTAKN